MKPDNIRVTTHERLGNKTGGIVNNLDGSYYPYGVVGTVVDGHTAVCSDCASEEELSDGPLIHTNDEWDYPGAICEECGSRLDTYLLVYRNMHPELWHKLVWSQQLGILEDPLTDDEKLAKRAEIDAYEKGYAEGSTIEDEITQFEAENNPEATNYPTDMAHYANNIAPELRALSGYVDDGGHGTYQTVVRDVSHWTFNEGVSIAFHSGYHDRIMNNREKWDSQQKYKEVIQE